MTAAIQALHQGGGLDHFCDGAALMPCPQPQDVLPGRLSAFAGAEIHLAGIAFGQVVRVEPDPLSAEDGNHLSDRTRR